MDQSNHRIYVPTLTRPKEPHVLLSPSPETPRKQRKNSTFLQYTYINLPEQNACPIFTDKTIPVRLYISRETNCVILAASHDAAAFPITLRYRRGQRGGLFGEVIRTRLPAVAYTTAVLDFIHAPGLLIFRWPRLLYDPNQRTNTLIGCTIDGQRRESQLIEATYPPLADRPAPYPFFVPALPLDPFWTPPDRISLEESLAAAAARRKARANPRESRGRRR